MFHINVGAYSIQNRSHEINILTFLVIKTCLDQQGSITKTCLKYLINLCNEEFRGEFEDEHGYIIQYNTEDDTFDTSTELDSESQTGYFLSCFSGEYKYKGLKCTDVCIFLSVK